MDADEFDVAVVELTRHDLVTIRQALNEVLHAIDVPDFETRMGTTRAEAKSLLARLTESMSHLRPSGE